MIDPNAFTKLVPGLDFLQGLMGSASQGMPAMGQWVAPTLDPAEIDKRIGELKTVQFWLEQNARMIASTIQALEVQRMTLSTLQTMNLPMAELKQAMTLPEKPARTVRPAAAKHSEAAADGAARPGAVDPMQWWNALTQQFGQIAARAVQDGQAIAASSLAAAGVKAEAGRPTAAPPPKRTPRKTARKAG